MNDNSPTPDYPPQPSGPAPDNTASHGKRLAAAGIDIFIMIMCVAPVIEKFKLIELAEKSGTVPADIALKLVIYQLFMFFVLHGLLLHRHGQTIGKRLIGIAIVTLDNQKPAFLPLIFHRYVSQWIMGMIPVVGIFLRLADILAIFREDKRCIHDMLAKTKVIDLRIPVTQVQGKPTSIIV